MGKKDKDGVAKNAAGYNTGPQDAASEVYKPSVLTSNFETDFGNFLGENLVIDKEIESSTEEEEDLVPIGPSGADQAGRFWRQPDIPDKYPLDHVNVENLVNMLAKIRLVWPEDLPQYDELDFSTEAERAKFPPTFYHNTDKEKIALWHAENFRRQYLHKFPGRRPIVIAPKNECGCQKLFPTYINPTTFGYPEFLDSVSTVEFLKDFFSPDLMEPPTKFPERIRSHVTVIKKRKANAFEMCIIAVSSLIGAGYNAYVVDGYVTGTVSTIDTTEDYHEPPEKPFLNYDPNAPVEEDEKKNQGFIEPTFDYGYLLDEPEEEALPPISPSKYRFKKKGEGGMDGNPVGDVPVEEEPDMEPDAVVPSGMSVADGTEAEGEDEEEEEDTEVTAIADDVQEGDEEEDEEDEDENEDAQPDEGFEDDEEVEEEEEPSEPDEELPPYVKDRYHGVRTHAWILVLPGGQQDVDQPYFLEPFSGTRRAIKDPNFLGIEAVFNHKNYWINIQPPPKNLRKLSYQLGNSSKWSALLNLPEKKKKGKNNAQGLFGDDDDEDGAVPELCLTMPVSWTTDLDISQEEYDMKYPLGKKVIEYSDAIVELAAPYVNDDGLVRKVLKFTGPSRDPEDLEYIEEKFEHRKDKLTKRMWLRDGKLLHEHFAPGRKDALKEHVHVSGRNKPDFPRDLYYYSDAHPRCLVHRKIIKKGMIEHFEGREDKLYYKTTLFGGYICNTIPSKDDEMRSRARNILELVKGSGTGGGGGKKRARRKITKIIQKYGRNEELEPTQDIAEKHMLIEEGRLRILFHYDTGHFTRNSLDFFKAAKPGHNKYAPVEFRPEDCIEYLSDREAEPMNVYKKFTMLQRMDRDERSASVYSREAMDETFQTVSGRVQEDWRHEIEPDAFAGDRNEEFLKMMREQQVDGGDEEEADMSGTDFTTPFFEKYGYPRNKRDEVLMKKRIMLHEKVKILRRAYRIKELYDTESSLLREKQEWYNRHIDQMNQTQEEDFSHMYKKRLFQMHILEQRLVRHKQESSQKYYNLLVDILKHPQLNRFTNLKVPPPPIPVRELTEEERARVAKELAKLQDCCQMYSVRFTEPRRSRNKNKQNQQTEGVQPGAAPLGETETSNVEPVQANAASGQPAGAQNQATNPNRKSVAVAPSTITIKPPPGAK